MPTPAWQARDSQQQRFVETMARLVQDASEDAENYDQFMLDFAATLFVYLHSLRQLGVNAVVPLSPTGAILGSLLPGIDTFIRVPEEKGLLLAKLFERLQPGITDPFYRDFQAVAQDKPREVYGTDRATDEIDYSD